MSGELMPYRGAVEQYRSPGRGSVVSAVLARAEQVMRERGQAKGSWGVSGSGPVCVEGAIAQAGIDLGLQPEELAEPMALVTQTLGGSIPRWNDAPQRTLTDATSLLQVCREAYEQVELR